jgi:hypothetical protein
MSDKPKYCCLENLLRPLHWSELALIGVLIVLHLMGVIKL